MYEHNMRVEEQKFGRKNHIVYHADVKLRPKY